MSRRPTSIVGATQRPRTGIGFAIAVVGYAGLAFQTPRAWGSAWPLLALFVLPALGGYIVAGDGPVGERAAACAMAVGIPIALYTLIGASIAHRQIHSDPSGGLGTVLLVTICYFVLAVAVASAANMVRGAIAGARAKAS